MFRTVRAFLLVLPGSFLLVLGAYLAFHPGAADAFVAYPFLAEALGGWVSKRPIIRFVLTSVVFFVPPYLVTGILLFVADAGVSAAAPLWGNRKAKRPNPGPPPESRWGFVAVSLASAAAAGVLLHRVAHGGELPGGVNVSPLFVVIAAFAAVALGLVAAGLVAVPRAVARRLGATP